MPVNQMMVPMSAKLCIDLIRFSDGGFTPASIGDLAETQLLSLIERQLEFDYAWAEQMFGERVMEFAEEYFPHLAERWEQEDADAISRRQKETRPLIWKGVSVPHGSEVRMHYAGQDHFAAVKNGRIVDDSGEYSPSEWASKVADNTSRNAWRDLWFKEPLGRSWAPAQLLREQARPERSAPEVS